MYRQWIIAKNAFHRIERWTAWQLHKSKTEQLEIKVNGAAQMQATACLERPPQGQLMKRGRGETQGTELQEEPPQKNKRNGKDSRTEGEMAGETHKTKRKGRRRLTIIMKPPEEADDTKKMHEPPEDRKWQ